MITQQQREERKLGIGGSDMPIILGLSNYKTPYQLYLEKIGEAESTYEDTELITDNTSSINNTCNNHDTNQHTISKSLFPDSIPSAHEFIIGSGSGNNNDYDITTTPILVLGLLVYTIAVIL